MAEQQLSSHKRFLRRCCLVPGNPLFGERMSDRGRVILNTGDGKGKTTAALGTAFRALGHGQRVCVIQFLKGQGRYGERMMAEKIDDLDWYICGKGFVFSKEDIEADRAIAREGFELAKRIIAEDEYDLVVLDEITYLPLYDFLPVTEIVTTDCQ